MGENYPSCMVQKRPLHELPCR